MNLVVNVDSGRTVEDMKYAIVETARTAFPVSVSGQHNYYYLKFYIIGLHVHAVVFILYILLTQRNITAMNKQDVNVTVERQRIIYMGKELKKTQVSLWSN